MCWTLEDYMMTKVLSKGLYEEWSSRVELIASVAWKIRLSEHSCLSPSHHLYQEKNLKRKWIHEDGAKRGSPIMVYGGVFGEVFIKHVLASTIKKGVPT
jgi:hypothetical protein